jgi:hypothetical protein
MHASLKSTALRNDETDWGVMPSAPPSEGRLPGHKPTFTRVINPMFALTYAGESLPRRSAAIWERT